MLVSSTSPFGIGLLAGASTFVEPGTRILIYFACRNQLYNGSNDSIVYEIAKNI
ncbi:hypothetical protein AAG068_25050 [Bacillus paramycoides]|uniref:hypothetical protein n=1 Tax=Bacillus paramycoides TaxID=2026194 RepID=UPI0031840340